MNDKNAFIIMGSVILLAIIIFIGFWLFTAKERNTRKDLQSCVLIAKQTDLKTNNLTNEDAWGKPVKYERTVDTKYVTYRLTSAGKDGTFDTEDDIVAEAVDLNKSRIVGDWVGKKAQQGWKGLKEGWGSTSKFDEVIER